MMCSYIHYSKISGGFRVFSEILTPLVHISRLVKGNCWRTTGDITDSWDSMAGIGFNQAGHEKHAQPGRWNDPDMLVVGWVGWGPALHPTHLTPNEQYTHISLWSLLASPLLIGCDLTKLDDFTLNLLTNDEVLDVNQDPLGMQAHRVFKRDDVEVWARPLEDGSLAVGLFNLGEDEAPVTVHGASSTSSGYSASGTFGGRKTWESRPMASRSRPAPRGGADQRGDREASATRLRRIPDHSDEPWTGRRKRESRTGPRSDSRPAARWRGLALVGSLSTQPLSISGGPAIRPEAMDGNGLPSIAQPQGSIRYALAHAWVQIHGSFSMNVT